MTTPTALRAFGSMGDKPTREICHDAAELIERQAAQIEQMREALTDPFIYWIKKQNERTYSPSIESDFPQRESGRWLDMVEDALSTTPDQALEQLAAKVREQCIEACRYTGCGIVGNMLSDSAIAKIRAIKELP